MDMEPTKKATILFSPKLYRRMTQIAEQRGTGLGELVRSACEREYGRTPREEKIAAIRRMSQLGLPVADVRRMKRESVPAQENWRINPR
jgi:hypothetical protein